MSEFFLELFSEEITSSLQKNLRKDLLDEFNKLFDERFISFKKSASYSTPNRAIILFEGLKNQVFLKSEEIKGQNIEDIEISDRAKIIQPVFQDPYSTLNPIHTIGYIVSRPLTINENKSESEVKEEVIKILRLVGLSEEYYNRFPNQLSGGQRQRVAIARAIILKPQILICDEPTSALDVTIQSQILDLLNDLKTKLNITIILISHDISVVKYFSDRIIVMYNGEIIEIGGSYRLPEIINETGLSLVEIGTTNKTRLSDYKKALEKYPNSLILKVHRSNFSISGFTEDVSISELAELKNKYDVFLLHDLGSGLVIDKKFLEVNNVNIFRDEPFVQDSLSDGSDLVMFSGDKLFGSVQSGMIAGNERLVKEIKNYSLFRTYRCSPITLFELQETAVKYVNKKEKEIPFWNLITVPYSSLEERCKNIAKSISFSTTIEKGKSVIGGGTLPSVTLESPILLIEYEKTGDIINQLIKNDIPIVPRIIKDRVCLDLRSVFNDQDAAIVQALNNT